jgi:hypothetical protein
VILNNTGTIDVTNISWGIAYEGGLVIPVHPTGTISEILIGRQYTIHQWVFGLGKKTVTVSLTADDGVTAEKTANVFLFLFFVIVVK